LNKIAEKEIFYKTQVILNTKIKMLGENIHVVEACIFPSQ